MAEDIYDKATLPLPYDGSEEQDESSAPFTGTVTSYAQQFEDIMLWRALRHVRKGFYIDLGASDPVIDSVSLLFYERGWRGIHVEASRKQAKKLRLARPDETVIEAVVSDRSGGKLMFSETEADDMLGLSTADRESRQIIENHGVMMQSYEVRRISVDDVFNKANGRDIHWLKIDVEGFEKRVLQGWKSVCRPWILVIESIIPLKNIPNHADWEPFIKKLGYSFVWSDRVNRFYVHEEHQELRSFFLDAPNFLDNFITNRHSWLCNYIEAERIVAVSQYAEVAVQRDDANTQRDAAFLQRDAAVAQSNELIAANTHLTTEFHALRGRNEAVAENVERLEVERSRLVDEGRALAVVLKQVEMEYASLSAANNETNAKVEQLTAELITVHESNTIIAEDATRLEKERSRLIDEGCTLTAALKQTEIEKAAMNENVVRLEAERNNLADTLKSIEARHSSLAAAWKSANASLTVAWQNAAEAHEKLKMRFQTVSEQLSAIQSATTWRLGAPVRWVLNRIKRVLLMLTPPCRVLHLRDIVRRHFPKLFWKLRCNSLASRIYRRFVYERVHERQSYEFSRNEVAKIFENWLRGEDFPEAMTMKTSLQSVFHTDNEKVQGQQSEENQQPQLIFEHPVSSQTVWPSPQPIDLFDTPPASIARPFGERIIYYYIDHVAATGVNTGVQQTTRRIATALLESGENLRFVKWSSTNEGITYCNADDMLRFTMGGTVPIPQTELERYLNGSSIYLTKDDVHPGDWFLCAECPHITVHKQDPTSELLYAAAALDLRTAFVFYDATPLKFFKDSTVHVPRHAEYMRSLLLADIVFCISRHVADDLHGFLTFHEKATVSTMPRIEVLPGLGVKSLKAKSTINATAKTILSVGSITTHKNQIAMIKAFAKAKRYGDFSGWEMRLVGNIHPNLEKEIRALAEECRDVSLLGVISEDALDEEYRRCAFTVFPSIMEGYGLPIIESLAYGKPCICANFGAMAEVAEKGACLTVDTTDVEALAKVIFRLADDKALRKELSQQASAISPPTWSDCAAAISNWMTEEDNLPRRLFPVYFCIDIAGKLSNSPFGLDVASAMAGQAAVIPTVWDGIQQCLRDLTEAERVTLGDSVCEWTPWRDPEPDNWLLLFSNSSLSALQVSAILKHAHEKHLYSACIVDDDVSDEYREAVSTATRLFPTSRRAKGQYIQFLTLNRLPFHSLDHRLQTCRRVDDSSPLANHYLTREILFRMADERPFHAPVYNAKRAYADDDFYTAFTNLQRRPKLSICISTYNRSQWLGISLHNLCSMLPFPDKDIELLIVDNASTDNTSTVVAPFLMRQDFRYIQNSHNVGMLGNLRVAAEEAQGQHVLILGDDDILHPNAIQTILATIDKYPDVPMVYHNYTYTFSPGISSIDALSKLLAASTPVTPPCPDEYGTVLDIATKNENFFTSIYAIIFRRDHALHAFSQFTGERPFSTMRSCIPTSAYVLRRMAHEKAYWIGHPQVMVNFNVSWNKYAPIHMLERVPELMETLERIGVARKRLEPYWMHNGNCFPIYWKEMYTRNDSDNRLYFSPLRALLRVRPVKSIDGYIADIKRCYEDARLKNIEATDLPAEVLFAAWSSDDKMRASCISWFSVV